MKKNNIYLHCIIVISTVEKTPFTLVFNCISLKIIAISLFRNKRVMLDEMTQWRVESESGCCCDILLVLSEFSNVAGGGPLLNFWSNFFQRLYYVSKYYYLHITKLRPRYIFFTFSFFFFQLLNTMRRYVPFIYCVPILETCTSQYVLSRYISITYVLQY